MALIGAALAFFSAGCLSPSSGRDTNQGVQLNTSASAPATSSAPAATGVGNVATGDWSGITQGTVGVHTVLLKDGALMFAVIWLSHRREMVRLNRFRVIQKKVENL